MTTQQPQLGDHLWHRPHHRGFWMGRSVVLDGMQCVVEAEFEKHVPVSQNRLVSTIELAEFNTIIFRSKDTLLAGWLNKAGAIMTFSSNKRWCMVNKDGFLVYLHPDPLSDAVEKRTIDLVGADFRELRNPFSIEITTRKQGVFSFQMSTAQEMRRWGRTFKLVADMNSHLKSQRGDTSDNSDPSSYVFALTNGCDEKDSDFDAHYFAADTMETFTKWTSVLRNTLFSVCVDDEDEERKDDCFSPSGKPTPPTARARRLSDFFGLTTRAEPPKCDQWNVPDLLQQIQRLAKENAELKATVAQQKERCEMLEAKCSQLGGNKNENGAETVSSSWDSEPNPTLGKPIF